jgi:hypothetical protein
MHQGINQFVAGTNLSLGIPSKTITRVEAKLKTTITLLIPPRVEDSQKYTNIRGCVVSDILSDIKHRCTS